MALRCGFVGCGGMGRELAEAMRERVEEAEVAAAFDPFEPNLGRFCEETGARPAGSVEELLARPEVEAVVIASPNDLHCEQTMAAAAAGKHVFCEKPMALSVGDCDRMIESCERAGVKLMVGHSMRLYPLVRRLVEVVRGGELGRPIYGFASYFFSGFKGRDSGAWHLERRRIGGLLHHMAIHQVDLFLTIFGAARRVQYAGGRYGEQVRDFDDVAGALVEFASGATATLSASSLAPVSWCEVVVLCSRGLARMGSPWSYLEYGAGEQEMTRLEAGEMAGPTAAEVELRSFARWVLYGEAPVFTGREGRAAVAVAEAADRARESGGPVEVAT